MAVTINKKDDAVKYTGSPLGPHAIASPFDISLSDLVKGANEVIKKKQQIPLMVFIRA